MLDNTLSYVINGQELVFEKDYYDYIYKKGKIRIKLSTDENKFFCYFMFDNRIDTEICIRLTSDISYLDNLSRLSDAIKKLSRETIPQIEKEMNIKWF